MYEISRREKVKYFSVESLNEKIPFGKYRNEKTLIEIFVEKENYGQWLINANGIEFAPGMRKFLKKAMSIMDRKQRREFIMQEYNSYMKCKKVSTKITGKEQKQQKQSKPPINIIKVQQATINGECKWETIFEGESKKRYSTIYHKYELIIEMSKVKDKETGKKKKKYLLQFCDGTFIAGHSDAKILGESVEKYAKTKISYFKQREEELLNKYEKLIVNGPDIIVRTNMWHCIKKHTLIDVAACFKLLVHKDNGEINVTEVVEHATYCPQCKEFFLQESTYDSLKKRGYLLHRIIGWKHYESGFEYDCYNMAEESMLHHMGYNVGKQDDLSEEVRWAILENVCNYGVMTRSEVVTFLNHLINTNGGKYNMDEAVGKWIMDRNHIQNYKINDLSRVNINNINR